MIKLSDYIFQYIKEKGVDHIFMLPGGGAMHLVDSIGKSGIEYICCQHEQAAAIAAEAYGQHTNHMGVALVTSGPGSTNAITGVTAGWIDSTPMMIVSGQAKRADLVGDKGVRQIGSQEVQIVDMVKPITKYAVQVLEPSEIRYHLEKAYCEATMGRKGPVWLDIPLDVQGTMIDESSLVGYEPKPAALPDISAEIEATISLLREAKKPLILAGNGIKLAGAEALFDKFRKAFHIPSITTWKAIDMMGEDDHLYVGHPGIMGDRGANLILQNADLLLCIGTRLDTSITAFNEKNFGKNAKKIIVDIDANELARMNIPEALKVQCDVMDFLKQLNDGSGITKDAENFCEGNFGSDATGKVVVNAKYADAQDRMEWLACCKNLRAKHPTVTDEHKHVKDFVNAYYFTEKLCALLKSDDVIVPESSGGAGEITYQAFQLKKGQRMKNAAGLGSMGFGLPYAIGSCLANGQRRTVLINGDGAFQLNIQELETLARLQLPIKIFIWNNGGYASIRSMQRNSFAGHYVASSPESGLTMPDICRVAEAYGIKTCKAKSNEEMASILPKVLESKGPMICELYVSPDETVSPRVKTIKLEDGSMMSTPLENMWPEVE